jgi:hypothetical protein
MGWSGIKNGALLSLADAEFDVLITIDQGFEYQQNLKERKIALLCWQSRCFQKLNSPPGMEVSARRFELEIDLVSGAWNNRRPLLVHL